MPKKDEELKDKVDTTKKSSTAKKPAAKTSTAKAKSTTKKATKTATTKKTTTAKKAEAKTTSKSASTKKTTTAKKTTAAKNTTTKKASTTKKTAEAKKTTTAKKPAAKKTTTTTNKTTAAKKPAAKKTTTTKKSTTTNKTTGTKKATSIKAEAVETKLDVVKPENKLLSLADKISQKFNLGKYAKDKSEVPPTSEETIIEKIKHFISKITAMQDEAKDEIEDNTKKATTKTTRTRTGIGRKKKEEFLPEYYDLPYRYNETVVKILAQTPKRLFVYWDISDADRERYKRAFGEDFFEKTYPVLLVHNEDKNYTSEIVVNDFANSWYIDIQDPKTRYTIQLGRKFRELPQHLDVSKLAEANIVLKTNYMEVCESNNLEAPNDHVLFNVTKIVRFRNVKTYEERNKDLSKLLTQYGKIYNIKDFYKKMYKEEIADGTFNLRNPSSGGWPSSSSTAF